MSIGHRLEIAWGGNWYDDPADLTWTDVTDRMRKVSPWQVEDGRDPAISRVPQPGAMKVRLDSRDGALTPENPSSPYYPDVQQGAPVRFSLQGTDWAEVHYGFIYDINPVIRDSQADWTQVDIATVDGWPRLVNAGPRLTYQNRVKADLTAGRTVEWMDGGGVEFRSSVGMSADVINAQDFQGWGVVWAKLVNPGTDWAKPYASTALVEAGGGDNSVMFTYYPTTGAAYELNGCVGGFASDRFGGYLQNNGPVLQCTPAFGWPSGGGATYSPFGTNNSVRQQVNIGRPPRNMLPAASETAAYWHPTVGSVAAVDALTKSWTPRSDSLDPVTGARTTVADGPTDALVWTGALAASQVVSDPFPVTAGKAYLIHGGVYYTPASISAYLEFLNSGGAVIGTSGSSTASSGAPKVFRQEVRSTASLASFIAPVGTVNARLVIPVGTSGTVELHGLGVYEPIDTGLGDATTRIYITPGRWWPQGASDHLILVGQWPLSDGGAALGITPPPGHRLWLHVEAQIDDWSDGELHSVIWNTNPGVGGDPMLLIDGVAVTASWRLTDPVTVTGWSQGTASVPVVPGTGIGQQYASYRPGGVPTALSVTSSASILIPFGLSGADRWKVSPNPTLARRWHIPYGAPGSVTPRTLISGDTGAMASDALDILSWPASQRDISAGRSNASVDWEQGHDLGDWSALWGRLAETEFGWVGIVNGKLSWKARRWYDPDLDGVAIAKQHLTWEHSAGKLTYRLGLAQEMAQGRVVNQWLVKSSTFGAEPALLEDTDSVDRIGPQRQELAQPWGTQTEVDEVAAEAIAIYGHSRVVPKTVVLRAYDPFTVTKLLNLKPSDVVLISVKRTPAPDLVMSALVGQRVLSSDGESVTSVLTLGPCPVPAVLPFRALVGLDTDLVPYFSPTLAEDYPRVSLDTDSVPYFSDPGSLSVMIDTDSVPYVEAP